MKPVLRISVLTLALLGPVGLAVRNLHTTNAQQTAGPIVYALTANNNLISFSATEPGTILNTVAITGLGQSETLVGIDFRPRNKQLYGVSSASRIYTINISTGAAAAVGTAAFTPALNGTAFGVDFNPVPDRFRVTSDADQNLRLNQNDGTVAATDTTLTYPTGDANAGANPNLVGVGYTNDFDGATSTTLYGIDSNLDILVRQGSVGGAPDSPNNGRLTTIGPLGVNTTDQVGFDITAPNDMAFASLTPMGASSSSLYSINLNTGAATLIGVIGGGALIRDIAIPITFIPSAQQAGFAVVNAASFSADTLAPGMIASAFGPFMTQNNGVFFATSQSLPTTLGGVKVSVNGQDAGLFFAGPNQINLLVPDNLGGVPGAPAVFTITDNTGASRTGTVSINSAAPGIFTADSTGTGTAAGFTTKDGVTYQSLINPDGSERPADPGTRTSPNFLVLFGTGIGNAIPNTANVAPAVTATIQGVPARVDFAGKLSFLPGVDQLNIIIPTQLSGFGRLRVRLVVNGQPSNFTTFTISGAPPDVTMQPIAMGQTLGGALSADDQVLRDDVGRTFFFDAYNFTATAGTGLAVDVRSTVFNPAVILFKRNADGSLKALATDDDLGGLGDGDFVNRNALLLTVAPEDGDYVAVVTSAETNENGVGGYTVRLAGNAVQRTNYGANVSGSIAAGDLQTAAGDFLDAYWFAAQAGDRAQITMSSANFDPLLILNRNNGENVAADDNGGGGTTAQITQTLSDAGIYVIIATPFAPNTTGAYMLSLTRLTGAGAGVEAAANLRQQERPGRAVMLKRIVSDPGEINLDSRFNRLTSRRVITR
ncbi:MAG TPA: DUF4394 domain-containing protein [Blastocatellia bacterium]|nr:DUF4394 domain-containing protein [Blastocatellia bacterium]